MSVLRNGDNAWQSVGNAGSKRDSVSVQIPNETKTINNTYFIYFYNREVNIINRAWKFTCVDQQETSASVMAPTEDTILRSFLLQKAGLRDVLTLAEFGSYFPASKRSSPLVRHLYRDLQLQRNAICESVLKHIRIECRLGGNLIAKSRAARDGTKKRDSAGTENEIDSQVHLAKLSLTLAVIWTRRG